MNIQQQSQHWREKLSTRKRNPVKPATLAAYDSYLRNWILPLVGPLEIRKVDNGRMRKLVAEMAEKGISASTIAGIENCLKAIIASYTDANGNEKCPRHWNNEFIDAPVIDQKAQKAPVITSQELNRAISTNSDIRPLLILLAASGLRISEALALKGQPSSESSYFDSDRSVLVIKKSLHNGKEQLPKTAAGIREVDLSPEVNGFLSTIKSEGYMFTNSQNDALVSSSSLLRDPAKLLGIPGFHSLRRFRVTHLRKMGVPEGLVKFWTGHAGKDITDRYDKVGQDVRERKDWAARAGIGFDL